MMLEGKTILVTGAGGVGVGSGCAEAVTKAGGQLVANVLTQTEAEHVSDLYPQAVVIQGDVSDGQSVVAMFETLTGQNIFLDGLVNNAGVGLSKPAHEAEESEFETLYAVDLKGVWLMTRFFTRHLLAEGRTGSIVNISSVHAHATISRYAIYASAKAGVEGLTRGLAAELGGQGIRCNAVAPGYVHSEQNLALLATLSDDPEGWVKRHCTNQQALEHDITPLDVGWSVAFLLSDLARSVTGQVLRVDNGTTTLLYNKDFI